MLLQASARPERLIPDGGNSQAIQPETTQEFLGQFRGCTTAQGLYDGLVV